MGKIFILLIISAYLCTVFWGHAGHCVGEINEIVENKQIISYPWGKLYRDREALLCEMLPQVVPEQTQGELLKAVAVLLRTRLAACEEIPADMFTEQNEIENHYREAVTGTKGLIVSCEGEYIPEVRFRFSKAEGGLLIVLNDQNKICEMSLCQAEELLREKNDHRHILQYFFPSCQMEQMYNF